MEEDAPRPVESNLAPKEDASGDAQSAVDFPSAGAEEKDVKPVKLFLGGLSWGTTEEALLKHFSQYGAVQSVIVMQDRVTLNPRGFAFCTVADAATADRICSETHVLDGRTIDAKRSVPQEQKPKSRKIFVGGLASDTTEEGFREHFAKFGTIVDAQIMQDHASMRSRGFGFITFEEDDAVDKVFAAGALQEVAGKRVEIKTATPRGSGVSSGARGVRGPHLGLSNRAAVSDGFYQRQGQGVDSAAAYASTSQPGMYGAAAQYSQAAGLGPEYGMYYAQAPQYAVYGSNMMVPGHYAQYAAATQAQYDYMGQRGQALLAQQAQQQQQAGPASEGHGSPYNGSPHGSLRSQRHPRIGTRLR